MPRWDLMQKKSQEMITTILGNEDITVKTPQDVTYDFRTGEGHAEVEETNLKVVFETTDKDKMPNLDEGLRKRSLKTILSNVPINKRATVITNFDNLKYEVVIQSKACRAGGYTHYYETIVAEIENEVDNG